jgi:hypothetical protein
VKGREIERRGGGGVSGMAMLCSWEYVEVRIHLYVWV